MSITEILLAVGAFGITALLWVIDRLVHGGTAFALSLQLARTFLRWEIKQHRLATCRRDPTKPLKLD